ncbi:MAG: DUF3667 domain-containing protein [Chthoniobacterales bacterium]|nr:DUF3667 domain-containing protein [Chthoniobacterales bacterium]
MADEPTDYIIGDAVADALDQPQKKRRFFGRKKPAPQLTHCENCSAPLHGNYCYACGQHAIDYRRSLWRLLMDAADSFLDWDTKFLQTTRVLLLRPWNLTSDFNAGRRVRYAHPLRLYLLASIAFFLLAKLVNFSAFEDNRPREYTPEDRAEIDRALSSLVDPETPLTPEQRTRLEAARARWAAPENLGTPEQRAVFEKGMMRLPRVAESFEKRKQLRPRDTIRVETALALMEASQENPANPKEAGDAAAKAAREAATAEASPDAPAADASPPEGAAPAAAPSPTVSKPRIVIFRSDNKGGTKSPWEAWMEERVKEKIGEDGTKVELFIETLRNNIPTMMLCCIPLFAFVLKVLYIRQRRYYIEHLVYALHIHSFVYVAVIVITLLRMTMDRSLPAFAPAVTVILAFVVTAQVFISIRRVYGQGWFMTILKFLVGGMIYLWVLGIALGATAIVTLLLP